MFSFTLFGVRCRFSLLFPALLTALLLWKPDGLAVACLLASLIHEGGHLLAMMLVGVPPEDCTLSAFGARIRVKPMDSGYIQNILISLAGPLANVVSAGVLLKCGCQLPAAAHLTLAGLNLLPSLALDGGQILRCGLCLLGMEFIANWVVHWFSAGVLLVVATGGFYLLLNGKGNFSLLVVCGYLAALTFFSEKIEKTS